MMFKYPRYMSGRETWRLLDNIEEAEWCQGWVVRHEGRKEPERGETTLGMLSGHDSFHVQLECPEYVKENEPVGCIPAMLEIRPECYEQLRSGDAEWIEVIVVQLKSPKGEIKEYAVHCGYLLNDDGKTVEKLMTPVKL